MMKPMLLLADISFVVDPLVGIGLIGSFCLTVFFTGATYQRLKSLEKAVNGMPDRLTRVETVLGIKRAGHK
jgi:hypothetical protein